jgi:hypothetical protein
LVRGTFTYGVQGLDIIKGTSFISFEEIELKDKLKVDFFREKHRKRIEEIILCK